MKNLILHDETRHQIEKFIGSPSHALMISGPGGSGKHTLAAKVAESVLQLPADSFASYPYKMFITSEENKAIGIEIVRALEHFLSLKVPSKSQLNRAVIIEDAQLLTIEAQNALLKTLEEPSEGSFIILCSDIEQALLPTIRSRAQAISIIRPTNTTLTSHFRSKNFTDKAISQAYAISGGLPELMQALLDQTDHPLMQATNLARRLLGQSIYGRLLFVDELAKQRRLALDVSFILQQMARVGLQTSTKINGVKWQNILRASYKANEALSSNVQPKLILTELMLTI